MRPIGGGSAGFLPVNGGIFGLEGNDGADVGRSSVSVCILGEEADDGRNLPLKAATESAGAFGGGGGGGGLLPGIRGGAFTGDFPPLPYIGCDVILICSESEEDVSKSPSCFIPPVFLNFGMPPANRPPNWGEVGLELPTSLCARVRIASGLVTFRLAGDIPGIGGAPSGDGAVLTFASIIGADRSFVTVFFNFAPFVISPRSAP